MTEDQKKILEIRSICIIKSVMKFQIPNAQIYLNECKNFELQFNIKRSNKLKNTSENRFTQRIQLKDNIMEFDTTQSFYFSEIELDDILEIYPVIKFEGIEKNFKPTQKLFQSFLNTNKVEECWKLNEPNKSFVKLKYSYLNEKEIPNIKFDYFGKKYKTEPNKNLDHTNPLFKKQESGNFIQKIKLFDKNKSGDQDEQRISDSTTYSGFSNSNIINQDCNISALIKNNDSINSQVVSESKMRTTINTLTNSKLSIQYKNSDDINNSGVIKNKDSIDSQVVSDSKKRAITNTLTNSKLTIQDKNRNDANNSGIIKNKDSINSQVVSESITQEKVTKITYEKLKYLENERKYDTFAEAFFGVSIPDNPKLINDSVIINAPCKEESCSSMSAYKPEIIFKIPLNDKNFEINSIIASLCFPKGIKLCYNPYYKEIKKINETKNFLIVNTNANGVRYYIMTYLFYIRYTYKEFSKKYMIDPIKDYLNFEKETTDLNNYLNNIENEKDKKKDQKKELLDIYERKVKLFSELKLSDYIYLPMMICLLSKYPYADQMEKCLSNIFTMSKDNKFDIEDINLNILHLIKEVPVPPVNSKLMFFIPKLNNPIEINGPLYKDLPILNFHFNILLDKFSIENIILVHHLMLSEQKFLFIAESNYFLTVIIECFLCILYPLQWTYPYIPILSKELLKYLQTPLPFIMGIESDLFKIAEEYLNYEDDVFLIYIDKNEIKPYQFKEKKVDKQFLKEKEIEYFPEDNWNQIYSNLKEMQKTISKNPKAEINQNKFNKIFRKIFIISMIDLLGDCYDYVNHEDDIPSFNKENFLQKKVFKIKNFLDKLIDSQNFNYLLQTDKNSYPYYFKRLSKNNNKDKNKTIKTSSLFTEKKPIYDKTFFITPYFLPDLYKNYDLSEIKKFISDKFKNKPFEEIEDYKTTKFKDFLKLGNYQNYKGYLSLALIQQKPKQTKSRGNIKNITLIFEKNKQEFVDEYFKQLLSKSNQEIDNRKLKGSMKSIEIQKNFIKSLFQSKFHNNETIMLTEKKFKNLLDLIYILFLEFNDESDMEDVRLVTKSLFFYYKVVNEIEPYYIYQEIQKKKGSFYIWKNRNFWEKYYELEIKTLNNKTNDKIQLENIIVTVANHMKYLIIESQFIKNIVFDLAKAKSFYNKSFEKKIIKILTEPLI